MQFDLPTVLSILALIAGSVAPGAYIFHKVLYSPKIFFRVGGEQSGEPIQVAENGREIFAVGTKSTRKIVLSEVLVCYNPDEVDISKTKGADTRITVDAKFPIALVYPERRVVTEKHLQANYFECVPKSPEFSVKLTAVASVDETEIPSLLDMFSPRKVRQERIVKFRVVKERVRDLRNTGLLMGPYEAMQIEGSQSKEAVWAQAEKGSAALKLIETVEKNDK